MKYDSTSLQPNNAYPISIRAFNNNFSHSERGIPLK
jgi:hypothetical protein